MTNTDPPALLLTTWSDTEAEMVRQLLEHHGIQCSVSSEVPHAVLPLTVDGLGEVRVHVPAAALDEARTIVAAYRRSLNPAAGPPTRGVVVPMPVTVKAATRIDLAGGTLDIWPLYLYLDNPVTVNLAIDLVATAHVHTTGDTTAVSLESEDLHRRTRADTPDALEMDGPLALLARLVRHLRPAGGVSLRTAATVPAGSGLGGSSALAVAIAVALRRDAGHPPGPDEAGDLARLLADLEAQVLGVPTGVQDYYPALFGGVLELSFGPGAVRVRRLPIPAARLAERLVLVYEGASRSSGTFNLDMVQRFLRGDPTARSALAAVGQAAGELAAALAAGDLDGAGRAMAKEMEARRQLSPDLLTPATERLFDAAAHAGALSAKVCGAGGGGCSVYWAAAGRREPLARALRQAGGEVLEFHGVEQGLLAAGALPSDRA